MYLANKLTEKEHGINCSSLRTAKKLLLENSEYLSTHNKRLTAKQCAVINDIKVLVTAVSFMPNPTLDAKTIRLYTCSDAVNYLLVINEIGRKIEYLYTHNKNYAKAQWDAVIVLVTIYKAICWQA